jgi:hypothetical protein
VVSSASNALAQVDSVRSPLLWLSVLLCGAAGAALSVGAADTGELIADLRRQGLHQIGSQ